MRELFAQALLGDYDGEIGWDAVMKLRQDGSRPVFEQAAAWCLSGNPLERARAADILGQPRLFRDESYLAVAKMLEHEDHPMVLDSVIHALGHLENANAIPSILAYRNHASGQVRRAVTFALGCFPNHEESVRGLLDLTSDPDAGIRDWAVFSLGVLGDLDSPEIRVALLRCLCDTDEDVREEAAVGLGKRGDRRLVPQLLTMLDAPGLNDRVAEAAKALLGLDQDQPEWKAEDYRAALVRDYQIPE